MKTEQLVSDDGQTDFHNPNPNEKMQLAGTASQASQDQVALMLVHSKARLGSRDP